MDIELLKNKPYDLNDRIKIFVLLIFEFVEKLPPNAAARNIKNQLVRSASSVGANYRAAKRGRSDAEYLAKLGIVEEEADECVYWLELIQAAKWNVGEEVNALLTEANEITAIVVSLIKSAKSRRTRKR
jgi:four helix bundle protein